MASTAIQFVSQEVAHRWFVSLTVSRRSQDASITVLTKYSFKDCFYSRADKVFFKVCSLFWTFVLQVVVDT